MNPRYVEKITEVLFIWNHHHQDFHRQNLHHQDLHRQNLHHQDLHHIPVLFPHRYKAVFFTRLLRTGIGFWRIKEE